MRALAHVGRHEMFALLNLFKDSYGQGMRPPV